jgi:hypothetical protein
MVAPESRCKLHCFKICDSAVYSVAEDWLRVVHQSETSVTNTHARSIREEKTLRDERDSRGYENGRTVYRSVQPRGVPSEF